MKESSFEQTNNCLNLIRIIAALQVVLGHMIEHLRLPGNEAVLHSTYFLRGVPIFFAISGFLIWFSIERTATYGTYLKKRFWRIYPELWVAVIIEISVLVMLYRKWDIKSLVVFTIAQCTLFQFWTPASLRGFGVGTPNGALWTIGVIIQFYIIAWFFYKIMKSRKIAAWILGLVGAFVISWIGSYIFYNVVKIDVMGKLFDQTILKYFWLFYIGMFIARFANVIVPMLQRYWQVLLAVAFAFFWTGMDFYSGYYFAWSLLLVSALIGFAYKYPILSISPDISYGLFLYHMIVVNIFVNYGIIGKWGYALLVVIISSILAYISTVTVGKKSLLRKKMLIKP